jgi:L-aminopeptidase/D-esterase-like protein
MVSTICPRAREAGIRVGEHPRGAHNAITAARGLRGGHVTLNHGDGPLRIGLGPVRMGVTAIVPPGDDWYAAPVEAGQFVFNGAVTLAGLSLIDEFGRIEAPLMLTKSVGSVYEEVVRYMVEHIFGPRGTVPCFNPRSRRDVGCISERHWRTPRASGARDGGDCVRDGRRGR